MQAKRMQVRGWAVTWYQKEDWPRWRAICPDFAPDYDNWLARAEAGFKEHQNRGHFPEKIAMDPDEFLQWSRANGGKIDSPARSAYAIFILASRDKPRH
jgi:hypothetical protein